jgi:hypothetical protein
MEEWNAWLKDWGKLLRENLAASGVCSASSKKREMHAAPATPSEKFTAVIDERIREVFTDRPANGRRHAP